MKQSSFHILLETKEKVNKMKCPYCNKSDCIPEVVGRNIESYGSNSVNFNCIYCKKVVHSFGSVKIIFTELVKTDNKSDW